MGVPLPTYTHAGARALVLLHEAHLRSCIDTWKRACTARLSLPETDDECYASLGHLGTHLLGAARHYMAWCCEKLELPDPGFDLTPPPEAIRKVVDQDLEHVLDGWRTPLADVPEARFEDRDHASRWKNLYSIDAMLEHAAMHPARHEFQLRELLAASRR